MLATGSALPSGAAAWPWTTTVPGPVWTARETVMSSTVFVAATPGPLTSTTSPGRMSGVASLQQAIVPPLIEASPAASVMTDAFAIVTPSRWTATCTVVSSGKVLSSSADESGRTVIVGPPTAPTPPPPPPPPRANAPGEASAAVTPAASSAAPPARAARVRARTIVPCRPTLATPVPVAPNDLASSSGRRTADSGKYAHRRARSRRSRRRSGAHVDRPDAARLDRDDDAAVAGLVVGGDVGAVLAVQ